MGVGRVMGMLIMAAFWSVLVLGEHCCSCAYWRVCLGCLNDIGLRWTRLGEHEDGFSVYSPLSTLKACSPQASSLMNSKVIPVVRNNSVIPVVSSFLLRGTASAKPHQWGMAKADSHQWRNSAFGGQLLRNTIIKICCRNPEAYF